MNIDRDDEYATRYEAAPTIDEQIKHQKELCDMHGSNPAMRRSILASLEKLAALESQPAPVEPECITKMRRLPKGAAYEVEHKTLDYIDSLQSAQKLAQEEITKSEFQTKQSLMRQLEKAESINRRMVELLKEPSEGMINAGYPPNDERAQSWGVTEVFKAMSAELLKEAAKAKGEKSFEQVLGDNYSGII